jgi:uncharacterized damage-inducible protein DinB
MDEKDRDQLISYVDKMHERTRRVSLCIPGESLEHVFAPGKFTLGDTVRHLAGINRYMFVETVASRPSRYAGHSRELADGLPAVLGYQEALHVESMEILRGLPLSQFAAKCVTPEGASIAVWKWLRAMTEHEAHHRGQIYFMLGILGINTPPLFGLTSEQVRDRSVPL